MVSGVTLGRKKVQKINIFIFDQVLHLKHFFRPKLSVIKAKSLLLSCIFRKLFYYGDVHIMLGSKQPKFWSKLYILSGLTISLQSLKTGLLMRSLILELCNSLIIQCKQHLVTGMISG